MFKIIEYWRWRRFARKAIAFGRTAICVGCNDPIIPGDFVGICKVGDDPTNRLVHAGYHFSMSMMDAFCESGAVGSAIWTGDALVSTVNLLP